MPKHKKIAKQKCITQLPQLLACISVFFEHIKIYILQYKHIIFIFIMFMCCFKKMF